MNTPFQKMHDENMKFIGEETYTIVCKICEKIIGESESDDNGFAVCLECYYKK